MQYIYFLYRKDFFLCIEKFFFVVVVGFCFVLFCFVLFCFVFLEASMGNALVAGRNGEMAFLGDSHLSPGNPRRLH